MSTQICPIQNRELEELCLKIWDADDDIGIMSDASEPDPTLNGISDGEIINYLRQFFSKKSMSYGGPIYDHHVITDKHVEYIRFLPWFDCVDLFREQLLLIGKSVKYILDLFFDLQREMFEIGVKKEYSGGLLIVYLKLCHGFEL